MHWRGRSHINSYGNGVWERPGQIILPEPNSQQFNVRATEPFFDVNVTRITPVDVDGNSKSRPLRWPLSVRSRQVLLAQRPYSPVNSRWPWSQKGGTDYISSSPEISAVATHLPCVLCMFSSRFQRGSVMFCQADQPQYDQLIQGVNNAAMKSLHGSAESQEE